MTIGELTPKQVRSVERMLRSLLPQDTLNPVQRADVIRVYRDLRERLSNPTSCLLSTFIEERCHKIPGAMIKFVEFFPAFKDWLKARGEPLGPFHQKQKVIGALTFSTLASRFPYGIRHSNIRSVGNLSFDATSPPGEELILKAKKLKPRQTLQRASC